eukprot:TRINITY_DN9074_c0_g1_i1.p1 TRINITY_DN9074_c0_g1~~TRINITY_DN9074_c0_g1_i1.p1  ORF type:complete len:318 (+),score=-14.51 TRINITY_DN9074_c0_g1_i1:1727-2680(+)
MKDPCVVGGITYHIHFLVGDKFGCKQQLRSSMHTNQHLSINQLLYLQDYIVWQTENVNQFSLVILHSYYSSYQFQMNYFSFQMCMYVFDPLFVDMHTQIYQLSYYHYTYSNGKINQVKITTIGSWSIIKLHDLQQENFFRLIKMVVQVNNQLQRKAQTTNATKSCVFMTSPLKYVLVYLPMKISTKYLQVLQREYGKTLDTCSYKLLSYVYVLLSFLKYIIYATLFKLEKLCRNFKVDVCSQLEYKRIAGLVRAKSPQTLQDYLQKIVCRNIRAQLTLYFQYIIQSLLSSHKVYSYNQKTKYHNYLCIYTTTSAYLR